MASGTAEAAFSTISATIFTVDGFVGLGVIFLPIGGKQITLKLTIHSEPQLVMNNFRPVLLPVYESLEAAIPVALELIEQRNWSRTPQLFSHLVRAEVKTLLNGKACPVEYDDEIRVLQMATVSMEGLAVPVGSVDFKILKGEVLRPANSEPRANFYQQSNNHLWATDEDPELKSLVILWECNANGTGLRLYLVCPMDAAGNCVWRMLIPPPAEWMIIADSSESGGGNQGGGDLDIGRKNDTDEQTGEKSR